MASKARSRTKKRLMEIRDHLMNHNTLQYVNARLAAPPLSLDPVAKFLVHKMLSLNLIDDYTAPEVFDCLAASASEMKLVAGRCSGGNGFELLSSILGHAGQTYSKIASEFDRGRTNYTTAVRSPDEKCLFWTLSLGFFIIYYQVKHGKEFEIPVSPSKEEFDEFFNVYPDFIVRTWDARALFQFRFCMKHIVPAYGNGNNKACLVEMVTRLTKGREIALTCNTSGGAMKKETIYSDDTEVAAECCRVRIYQKESGVKPRRRDHSNLPPETDRAELAIGQCPSMSRVSTSDVRLIADALSSFQHGAAETTTRSTKRRKTDVDVFPVPLPRPVIERTPSSGFDSLLAAASGDLLAMESDLPPSLLDGRTFSEDISNLTLISTGISVASPEPQPWAGRPKLSRMSSSKNSSTSSASSFGLERLSPIDSTGTPMATMSRITSTDWPKYSNLT